jgi:glycosyltransferase involved in cell wall biosynthesis
MTKKTLKFSVVVCTHNRDEVLGYSLQGLANQELPSPEYEIIVVDNRSTDKTKQVVREIKRKFNNVRIRYIYESELGISVSRNAGIKTALGDIIAFIDDDAVASPQWLLEFNKVYEQQGADVVGGKVELQYLGKRPAWLKDALEGWLSKLDKGDEIREICYPDYLVGTNISFRRDWFDRVGGFDVQLGRKGEKLSSGEECDLHWRMESRGAKVYYAPYAEVRHLVNAERLSKRWFRKRLYHGGRAEVFVKVSFEGRETAFKYFFVLLKRLFAAADRGEQNGLPLILRLSQFLGYARCFKSIVFPMKAFLRDVCLRRKKVIQKRSFYSPESLNQSVNTSIQARISSIKFIGYELCGRELKLFFEIIKPFEADYRVFMHFYPDSKRDNMRKDENLFVNLDHEPAVRASRWKEGKIFIDSVNLRHLPRGRYRLRFGFFDRGTLERVSVEHVNDNYVEIPFLNIV